MEILFLKISKIKPPTASKIQAFFSNFHLIFFKFWQYFLLTFITIDFGLINLPRETKFYKKSLARILWSWKSKIRQGKFTKFWRLLLAVPFLNFSPARPPTLLQTRPTLPLLQKRMTRNPYILYLKGTFIVYYNLKAWQTQCTFYDFTHLNVGSYVSELRMG